MYEKCDKRERSVFYPDLSPNRLFNFQSYVTQAYEISFHSLSTNLNLGV